MMIRNVLLVTMVVAIGGGCGTLQVSTQQDTDVDLTEFETFNFDRTPAPDADPVHFNQMTQEVVRKAISQELEKRGYQLADEPDLMISLYLKVEDKQQVRGSGYYGGSSYYGRYYGYHPARYGLTTVDYTEGTLIIDLVDREANRLVWQGVANDLLNDPPKDTEKAVNSIIMKVFEKYPSRVASE